MKNRNCAVKYSFLLLLTILIPLSLSASDKAKKDTSNKIITLSAKDYEKETKEGLVLVDFWAVWCGPCRIMEPILKDIANETNIKVAKLDIDDYKAFVNTKKISIIPTMIIYKNGVEVERLSGVYEKEELLKVLKSHM